MDTIKTQYTKALLTCLALAVIVAGVAYAQSEEITLVGEINDAYQLVADNEVYDIDDTPLGDDLAQNYISVRVKVTGTVQQGEELRIIRVKSFESVDE